MPHVEPAASGRPGPRPRLSRAEVLRAALTLIDEGGTDAFSMRQLAVALDVGVMTIYGYVRNKEELFGSVCELAFSDMHLPEVDDGPWDRQVESVMTELHEICLRHPNLVAIVLSDNARSLTGFTRRGRVLDALVGAGFPPPTAHRALAALLSITIGSSAPGSRALRDRPAQGDKGSPSITDHEAFRYGLELLLAGLRVDLARLTEGGA